MEDMYSMRCSMQMPYFYPFMTYPMMYAQPVNINPMMMSPIQNCMNCSIHNTLYRTSTSSYGMPMRNNIFNPNLFQVKMRTVSVKEIED